MIADRLGVRIERLEVEVNGDADVRGCLAMSRSVRPGFRQMQCRLALGLRRLRFTAKAAVEVQAR